MATDYGLVSVRFSFHIMVGGQIELNEAKGDELAKTMNSQHSGPKDGSLNNDGKTMDNEPNGRPVKGARQFRTSEISMYGVLPRTMDPGEQFLVYRATRVLLYDQFIEQWLERDKQGGQPVVEYSRFQDEGSWKSAKSKEKQ
ncbi:MAG: hypothetical protein J3Q66DRAFT_404875 [Benniella sp.]|nr:MAG: hypothetical protein J3Q66DRAFT_404875 [Benniella sp.]